MMLQLDSTPQNTYILSFWSTNTGECGCSGDVCVPGGGEREQTPIVPPPAVDTSTPVIIEVDNLRF